MYTATFLTTILPLLSSTVLAVPLPQTDTSSTSSTTDITPFGVMSLRSASPVHFLLLNAYGNHFYLGGNTSSYCPETVTAQGGACPPGNQTILGGVCSMNVEVPGGQQTYITPEGIIGFTTAHSAYVPSGAVTCPFTYTPVDASVTTAFNGTLTPNAFNATGFMACPTPANSTGGAWQVFAALQNATVPLGNVSDCLGFDAVALSQLPGSGPAAWEYI